MAELATVYVARAPRYILSSEDNALMFFAHKQTRGEKQQTVFLNLSASGLAFATERDLAPNLGDQIKIEFTAPGEGKVAWWARVVRIEEYQRNSYWGMGSAPEGEDLVYIAVKFQDLPNAHQSKITKGIQKKFRQIKRAQNLRSWAFIKSYVFNHKAQLLLYGLTIVFSLWLLFALSRPTSIYDKDRGTPWGLRFKQIQHDYLGK